MTDVDEGKRNHNWPQNYANFVSKLAKVFTFRF